MHSTTLASNYTLGRVSVDQEKVFVPFSVRSHPLWQKMPNSFWRTQPGGWKTPVEYVSAREARSVGAKNIRPDGAGLALVCDWPKHLLP